MELFEEQDSWLVGALRCSIVGRIQLQRSMVNGGAVAAPSVNILMLLTDSLDVATSITHVKILISLLSNCVQFALIFFFGHKLRSVRFMMQERFCVILLGKISISTLAVTCFRSKLQHGEG